MCLYYKTAEKCKKGREMRENQRQVKKNTVFEGLSREWEKWKLNWKNWHWKKKNPNKL